MNTTNLDVSRVLVIIGERWKIVLACTLLVAGAAFAYTEMLAKPIYEAQALVTYQAPSRDSNPTAGALPSTGVTREDIGTLIGNTGREVVVEAAARKAGGVTAEDMRKSVTVRPHGDASILDFVARSGDPEETANLANAYASAFVSDRQTAALAAIDQQLKDKQIELRAFRKLSFEDPRNAVRAAVESDLSKLRTQRQQWSQSISVSTEAQAPKDAVWPRTTLTLIASLLIGLGLGCGVALLTARVDRQLHGDGMDELPAPVLVKVPHSSKAPRATPLGPALAEPLVADAFAALGARVMLDRTGEGAHVVLISSARAGEGKSTVAANLASALAQGGRRVVLIDADMRRPTQDTIFPALQNRPGLAQILGGAADVEQSLTLVAPNLAAISSGPRQNNASVLLASVAFRQLIDRISNISEVIVIDAPPALAVTDAMAIAPTASQILLVARVGTSNVGEISEAHAKLAAAANTPQSMVLLGTERPTGYGYDQDVRTGAVPLRHPGAPGAAA